MDRLKTIIIMALMVQPLLASQKGRCLQDEDKPLPAQSGSSPLGWSGGASSWYGGIEGGVPFGISTFCSFGADKTRAGYAFGLFGGYRFNPVLSAELTLKWGKASLSARECCAASGHWLGADGSMLTAPMIDGDCWSYADLKSSVTLQQYGVRLNVNLLGLFAATRQSRWTLEVSPVLAAVGTKATVKTIADDANVLHGGTEWHLGAGGNLQANYALTKNLRLGVYSGITWLTGSRMDGMPEHSHNANYIWESGVRIGWTFGKKKKEAAPPYLPEREEPELTGHVATPTEPTLAEATTKEQPTPEQESRDTVSVAMDTASSSHSGRPGGASEGASFPTVYFAFNRTDIAAGEAEKLHTILGILKEHPDVQVLVTGWCDSVGSRAVNDRISRKRAEAVKDWLVSHGIDSDRIRTAGKGTDTAEPDAAKARRAETERQGKEVQR